MASGPSKKIRAERVSRNLAPRESAQRWLTSVRDPLVLQRVGWCCGAALVMCLVTQAYRPPFPYRAGYIPPRDIAARCQFSVADEKETELRRRQARSETLCVYEHDEGPIVELRKALKNQVFQVIRSASFAELDKTVWADFLPAPVAAASPDSPQSYEAMRTMLSEDPDLARFEKAIELALADYQRDGLLENLTHKLEEGSQTAIWIHPIGKKSFRHRAEVKDVRIAEATADLDQRLRDGFTATQFTTEQAQLLSQLTAKWLQTKTLPATLTLNRESSEEERRAAERAVEQVLFAYNVGDKLVSGGRPLQEADVGLLRSEYAASLDQVTAGQTVTRLLAILGMYFALYVLCGTYSAAHERRLLTDAKRLLTLLAFAVATVALCTAASRDEWRAEIIPLTLFSLTVGIAYHREFALLTSTAIALAVVLSLGFGLDEFVVLSAAAAAPVLLVRRVRYRTRLIYVGLMAGLVVLLTALGVGVLFGQSFASPHSSLSFVSRLPGNSPGAFALMLLSGALWFGFCSFLSGLLMTGLLPFVERLFDVQTDLRLLELGNPAHPLLQELARRAPGTYNHSMNVASLAEAAAESIGGNGLLARVGAYFHDVGKMAKPQYFVENQGQGPSRHESLLPAMSTLVIIAHVKDGAELARRHQLPPSIIDFIEQHHGTTLVEYFYGQAARLCAIDPDRGEVDETSFRYPGPKPQTKEAAVLMVADAVESACRTLIEPAPARIESLVHDIAMKRLLDGQFAECGLTLRELNTIEESLVKSLTATYHSRVKYPDQQTA